jgi:hypothetical protein
VIIKRENYKGSVLNRFDLLGYDETGLSKAFAYLLAVEPSILYRFLRDIGIKVQNTQANLNKTTIDIERKRQEGRTDIEIRQHRKFHVIVECKVRSNRIKNQRIQYLSSFENEPQKVLCFITQERDCNLEVNPDIGIYYRGWLDIIDLVESRDFERSEIIREFINYATKGFKMRDQKEVLVQDVSNPDEITRFKENNIYRRDVTFGSPLYFAPYFTRAANETKGITYLSKVLGVITALPNDIESFKDELLEFANKDKKLVAKWLAGIETQKLAEPNTYYFLADPVQLDKPLLKDGGREKGRGKGWIAAMIPRNRCVTFEEFTRRIVESANKP